MAAAGDLTAIRSVIDEATAVAARRTTAIAAAAADEVSQATAALFNGFAAEGQAVIAQAAAFLLSEEASYISGTSLVLDGGTMALPPW